MTRRKGFAPRILTEGSAAHYRDAEYYDRTYRARRHDVRFYVELARKLGGGPVLELGAGSGRVALALAQAGIDVVAVDRMPEMLARARKRLAALPERTREHVTLVRGDLYRVRLRRKFPLVIAPFNVLMHVYTRVELERALATVRAHLAPRGRFVFDVLLPNPANLARNPAKLYRGRPVKLDDTRFGYGEAFDYDPVSQVQLVQMIFEHPRRADETFVTPLAHRQFFPAELEALLHYNGFEITDRFGDFDRGALGSDSESQVIIAHGRHGKR